MRSGSPVTAADIAARLDNEAEAILHWMVLNDLPQVWMLLHRSDAPAFIGETMAFAPNAKRAEAELKLLLVKKDYKVLNDIIGAFRVNMGANNETTHPDLIRQMELLQTLLSADGSYRINGTVS